MKDNKKVELLAPAGAFEQLVAAVENGADAVYLGGQKFNARMNASNFDLKEIRKAICYAKPRGVKVFITINILMKNEELQEALEYIADLYEIGVDGVIVQDIGLAVLIKKYVPNMELHFSTQGSIYNRSGVKNALNIGFDRVVLAREMTLEEIRETTDLCDIEVFVHGALCMCYSGQCQLSRAIGGRSGNRGECAQPCRLPYTDDKGETGYFLSPKDICTIDHLGELIEAGVASLKIEGRMKSPEYVATVVGIYRKYIDKYYDNGSYEVSEEDRKALLQIFNRGSFTEGYLTGNPGEELLSGDLPKHQGTYIGKVTGNGKRDLIEVELTDTLQLGDGIEIRRDAGYNRSKNTKIQNTKLVGGIVTYIEEIKDKSNKDAKKYLIGDIKGEVFKGQQIYKTSSKALLEKARKTYEKPTRRRDIEMVFTAITGSKAELIVYDEDLEVSVLSENLFEKAVNRPLDEDRVEKQLKKTGDTPFNVEYLTVSLDGVGTMAISEINKMRRQALEKLEEKINSKREKIHIPKIEIGELDIQKTENYAIRYSSITKGAEDQYIKNHLTEGPVILNNLGWIEEFLGNGVKVYGGSGLNVYNAVSQQYFQNLGVTIIELAEEAKETPKVLMTTEHPINSKYLIDRKGAKYQVEKSEYGDKWNLVRE